MDCVVSLSCMTAGLKRNVMKSIVLIYEWDTDENVQRGDGK